MKILHFNTTFGTTAPGYLVQTIGQAATEAGHDVSIAYDRAEPKRRRHYMAALRTRLFDSHGHSAYLRTMAFIYRAAEFAPDVVHLHNLHGYWIHVPLLLRWLARTNIPVVWTLHDFWPLTGHCAFPHRAGCDRWLTGCHHCPQKGEYPASWFADRSERNYAERRKLIAALPRVTFVALSEWQAAEVRRALPDARVEVIPNPVDTTIFRPSATPLRPPKMVLGAANVWDARKGLERFVELRRALPSDYKITLAGLTDKQIRSLPEGIQGLRRINSREDMAMFLASGSVFVNLSDAETLGMVNLEARACGTPVVTLASGGLAETVTPDSGIVLSNFYPATAALAIKTAATPGRFHQKEIRRGLPTPARALSSYLKVWRSTH